MARCADFTQADELIEELESEYVIADLGYDADEFRRNVVDPGSISVIPPPIEWESG